MYTWDYRSSDSIWAALRVLPVMSDEVQTFKALITVHKIMQEGHPMVRPSQDGLQTPYTHTAAANRPSKRLRGRPRGSRLAPAPWAMTLREVSASLSTVSKHPC